MLKCYLNKIKFLYSLTRLNGICRCHSEFETACNVVSLRSLEHNGISVFLELDKIVSEIVFVVGQWYFESKSLLVVPTVKLLSELETLRCELYLVHRLTTSNRNLGESSRLNVRINKGILIWCHSQFPYSTVTIGTVIGIKVCLCYPVVEYYYWIITVTGICNFCYMTVICACVEVICISERRYKFW